LAREALFEPATVAAVSQADSFPNVVGVKGNWAETILRREAGISSRQLRPVGAAT